MSNLNQYQNEPEETTPGNLLKLGIDSIILLFENKNNEYLKNISESQIIINNLENKNKKLIKENYLLRKNNIRQSNIIKELKNENENLKNIINSIKGKLNIDSNIPIRNNSKIENNKIKINKININNFNNRKRTRNISNLTGQFSQSSFKDICLTDREKHHRKNNVFVDNVIRNNKQKIFYDKNFENNIKESENIFKIKNNYYTRQRSKNNSFNQYLFNKMNYENIRTIENSDHKKTINFNNTNNVVDNRNLFNFHTIDINDSKDINRINPGRKNNKNKVINSADKISFDYLNNEYNKNKRRNILVNNFLKNCKNNLDGKRYKEIYLILNDSRNETLICESNIQKINFILKNDKMLLNEFENIKEIY